MRPVILATLVTVKSLITAFRCSAWTGSSMRPKTRWFFLIEAPVRWGVENPPAELSAETAGDAITP